MKGVEGSLMNAKQFVEGYPAQNPMRLSVYIVCLLESFNFD